jgi:hypothetical protein
MSIVKTVILCAHLQVQPHFPSIWQLNFYFHELYKIL